MNLKELKDRIKNLKENPEEDIGQIVIDSELKGIRQTVEAIEDICIEHLRFSNFEDVLDEEDYKLWQEIKNLLSLSKSKKGD